jgi:hypothetical protein
MNIQVIYWGIMLVIIATIMLLDDKEQDDKDA